jgi:hypothetical protein
LLTTPISRSAVPSRRYAGVFFYFGCKAQAHERRCGTRRSDQWRAKTFDKAAVRANRESALHAGHVQGLRARAQQRARFVYRVARPLAQRFRTGRQHHAPAGAHQQRIARCFA